MIAVSHDDIYIEFNWEETYNINIGHMYKHGFFSSDISVIYI